MTILQIIVIIFLFLELSNVLALYFKPDSANFNSVGIFNAWDKSKDDQEIHSLVQYLVYWVAGTKLIFISLMIVILLLGDTIIQLFAVMALMISTSTFYWKLFPLIKSMDEKSELSPKNYSRTLGIMILIFLFAFAIAVLSSIVWGI